MMCAWMKILGFTLVELLMVVFIIGILAATAMPVFTRTTNQKAEADGERVKATIEEALALAYARNTDYKVGDQGGGTQITLCKVPAGGPVTPDPDDYTWNLRYGPIVSANFGGADEVVCDSNGTPTAGGDVVIDYGGLTQTLTVSDGTGFISIAESP